MTLYTSRGPCTTCHRIQHRYLYRGDYQWYCAPCLVDLAQIAICEDEVSRLIPEEVLQETPHARSYPQSSAPTPQPYPEYPDIYPYPDTYPAG